MSRPDFPRAVRNDSQISAPGWIPSTLNDLKPPGLIVDRYGKARTACLRSSGSSGSGSTRSGPECHEIPVPLWPAGRIHGDDPRGGGPGPPRRPATALSCELVGDFDGDRAPFLLDGSSRVICGMDWEFENGRSSTYRHPRLRSAGDLDTQPLIAGRCIGELAQDVSVPCSRLEIVELCCRLHGESPGIAPIRLGDEQGLDLVQAAGPSNGMRGR